MAGYVVAQIGAYVSFLPLLMILVPLKAAGLASGHKALLLSEIASLGAVVAACSNLLAGWISDRTRGPWGRRRPWIVAGALATALSYGLVYASGSPVQLVGAILVFQLVFNFAFAPLGALIPDRVPDDQKGWVAALTGLGLPLGSVLGSAVVGMLVFGEAARLAVLGAIVIVAIVPFALSIRDPQPPRLAPKAQRPGSPGARPEAAAGFSFDFVCVWIGRCFVQTGFGLVQIYLLFFLQETLAYGPSRAGRPEADMATLSVLFGVANVLAGLIVGRLSDKVRRRKPFVIGGAVLIGAAAMSLAAAGAWPAVAIAYTALGCGAGGYFAVDLALVAQVLPSLRTAGRDLGVINLSITIPQVAAPALAGLLLAMPGAHIRWIFVVAAALAVLGAGTLALIRRIR
jgi:MFS family permease